MKKTFLLLFCIFSYYSWAQIEVISIAPSHQNTKHFRLQESPIDTLSLPFFDDFSTTNTGKLDTKKWLSSGVYVNNTFCQNPPNFQVASFDGTNQYGQPYSFLPNTDDINLIINDFTDNLTSKPIDLSTITASSDLVFSFFWQKGGYFNRFQKAEEGVRHFFK